MHDQPAYPWAVGVNGNTAADYVSAWRHVRALFRQAGASNVQWVWNPNTLGDATAAAYQATYQALYPWDSEVDLIGLDIYNTGPQLDWGAPTWRSFASVLAEPYKAITAVSSKPMILPEVGTTGVGGSKASWIADMFEHDLSQFPRVRALVWFDVALTAQQAKEGDGLRIMTQTVTSPTLAKQCRAVLDMYPKAKWHQYEPINRDNARGGSAIAFGQDVACVPAFRPRQGRALARVRFPGQRTAVRAHDARLHEVAQGARGRPEMNRLYVVESTPTSTGAVADHRLAMRSSDILHFVRALAQRLGVKIAAQAQNDPLIARWIHVVAKDLEKHRGSSLVVAGESQHPIVHALVHLINTTLGNANETVSSTRAPSSSRASINSIPLGASRTT